MKRRVYGIRRAFRGAARRVVTGDGGQLTADVAAEGSWKVSVK